LVTDRNSLRAVLRERFPRDHGQLLPALHFLQHEFGYLPDWAMEVVGWHLGIPASEVYGAATSYSELRLQEPGTYVIRVCTGLSCWINGGKELVGAVESELHVHSGQTTPDGLITLEETPCGYLCGLAPVIEWCGSWRGRATPESVKGLIQKAKAT
jgi:NADH:ubiquinone oxidoreductase subunit E